MINRLVRRTSRAPALLLVILSVALVAAGARPGGAQDTSGFYQSTAIVTGYDMRSRPKGFAQCLRDVLVKVSGETRLRDDPRVAELAAHADALVVSFDYVDQMAGIKVHDDQGTYDRSYNLTVRFDPAKIDLALADLGEHPWRGERPVVVPAIVVRGYVPPYLLSAEAPAGAAQRGSLEEVASEYDMKVRIPTDAELAAWGVTVEGFPAPKPPPLPGQVLVAGTIEFKESPLGWMGSWRMRWHDTDYVWDISGVNYDTAFRDVIRGVVRVASDHGAPR